MGFEDQLSQWFLAYAYEPAWVYSLVVVIMFASSFGLPLPEEVILVSAGLAGYMASHPAIYPPPYPGAQGVEPVTLAIICLLAVFISDYLIYWIGSYFGYKLLNHPKWGKRFRGKTFQRVQKWIHDYGIFAPFIFRFTPGLRFPGHMMCGAIGLSRWKFICIDGMAALLTVPTQIILISIYGEVILKYINRGKYFLLGAVVIGALVIIYFQMKKRPMVEEPKEQTDYEPQNSPTIDAGRSHNPDEKEPDSPSTKCPPSPGAKR